MFGKTRSNAGGDALPAGRDTSNRHVSSEPAYTSTTYAKPETHRLLANGTSVPRTGTPAPLR